MEIKSLKEKFIKKFGNSTEKTHVYFSPGRVNLIGEHTDYNGGFVFPCTISYGTYCLIRKNNSDVVRLVSLNLDYKAELKLSEIKKIDKEWINYPLGVIYQFQQNGFQLKEGIDLMFYGNVPGGAGLSSSASLEMSTAFAINDFFSFEIDKIKLAKMGQKAEHEFAGVNCGIMDQFTSVLGKENNAIFLNCDTLEYELVPIKLNDAKIIISNTNSPHKLDNGKYNAKVSQCKAAVEALKPHKNISLLGEISPEEFKKFENNIKDKATHKSARHVVSEIQRTKDAVKELKANNIDKFGELMNQSHDSLREDYEVTGIHLDTLVEEARKINGVVGSRMTGGGFGGSTVSIVKNEAIDEFIEKVGKNYEAKTGIKPEFYIAEIVNGAHKIE
ncbi:galactokinase [Bacteroidota bacterium]